MYCNCKMDKSYNGFMWTVGALGVISFVYGSLVNYETM